MPVANQLLDLYKAARKLPSDAALARELKKTTALVSQWRKGGRQPQEADIEKLCRATGEDEGVWLTMLAAERAVTAKGRESLMRLVDLAKKYGHAACLALLLGVVPAKSEAKQLITFADNPASIHYAQF